MKYFVFLCTVPFVLISCFSKQFDESPPPGKQDWAIIIHGGAGGFWSGNIDPDIKEKYFNSLEQALSIGSEILENGGSSLDAVEKTIRFLENDTMFNAGKGAVLTSIGTVELDASIMNGDDLNSGAVAGVRNVKNPISAAIAVMNKSPHVMLAGVGAEKFAEQNNLELVENDYFITHRRKKAYELEKLKNLRADNNKMGTVGCVALDKNGNIVAGTSTGGTSNKRWGRVGDSPIIGAGTYANSSSCGVSATGAGEFFIRGTVARDIAALMEYKNMEVQDAAEFIIQKKLLTIDKDKAVGGVVCLDRYGNPGISFNTYGMLRAYNNADGMKQIALY